MNIEESIERIKRKITIGECEKNIGIPVYISDLKAVLEELENKQDDINILQAQRDSMEYQFKQAKAELEKKDKVINEMAEWIDKITEEMARWGRIEDCDFCDSECIDKDDYKECKQCIKEYFTNKVEREGK